MAHHYWVPGNSAGPHVEKPGKLLLHTTEGSSIEGAVGAYRKNNSWPHLTVDYRFGQLYRICQHLTFDVAARSLRNKSGGVVTNTAGVIQIEIVGFATAPDHIDWVTFGREVVGPLCTQVSIPVTSTVHWVAYPGSYGEHAFQRLSGSDWLAYRGVLGHQHAPENDHGDPGAIPIAAVLAAANPAPKPKGTSSDMQDLTTHPDGNRVDHVLIGADGSVWHAFADTPAGLLSAEYEWLGGWAKSLSSTWANGEYVITAQGADASGGKGDNRLFVKRYTPAGWVPAEPGVWDQHPTALLRDPEQNV